MASFDPLSAAIGGALIGLAAALLRLLIGRIAGISGIFAGLIAPDSRDRAWHGAFLCGLIAAPLALGSLGWPVPLPAMPANWTVIVVAGLLVGYGTRLGSGCTSGHGICGLSRLSPRSIAATLIFMATAIIVVGVNRHLISLGGLP